MHLQESLATLSALYYGPTSLSEGVNRCGLQKDVLLNCLNTVTHLFVDSSNRSPRFTSYALRGILFSKDRSVYMRREKKKEKKANNRLNVTSI